MPIAEIIGLSGKLGLWTLGKPYIIPGREPIGLSSLLKCSEIISLDFKFVYESLDSIFMASGFFIYVRFLQVNLFKLSVIVKNVKHS